SGAAALAGVQPGDIILGVNGKPIQSVQQLRGAVKEKQSTVALLIERGNAQIFIPIRVGAPGAALGAMVPRWSTAGPAASGSGLQQPLQRSRACWAPTPGRN